MFDDKPKSTINFIQVLPKKERFAFLTWRFLAYFILVDVLCVLIVSGGIYWLEGGMQLKKTYKFRGNSAPQGYGLVDKKGFHNQLKLLSEQNLSPNWFNNINLSSQENFIGLYGYGEEKEALEQVLFKTKNLKGFWFKPEKVQFKSHVITDEFQSWRKINEKKRELSREIQMVKKNIFRIKQSKKKRKTAAKNSQIKLMRMLQRKIDNLNREMDFLKLIEIKFNTELKKQAKKKMNEDQEQALWLKVKSVLPCCNFSLEQNG